MYSLGITGLISSFLILILLLVSVLFYSKLTLKIKVVGGVISLIFFIISYFSFPPILGWATTEYPPVRFRLIAAYVKQPDKLSGEEGNIYLWLTKLEDLTTVQSPRSYKLPYSDVLHEKIINANAKLDKNIAQLGEFNVKQEISILSTEQSKIEFISDHIQFYDLPDPLFPEK